MSKSGSFSTTRWSLVVQAGQAATANRRQALELLCQRYWRPLYIFALRTTPHADDAEDLIQSFFAELLEKNIAAQADRTRGRFRTFLIAALKHFMNKQWQARRAQKRGGGQPILHFDFQQADSLTTMEPTTTETPEQEFERQWAVTLLNHVWTGLQKEMDASGKSRQLELLKSAIIDSDARLPFAEISAQLEMDESATRMAASRLRQRYRQLLRAEIADTLLSDDTIEDEIRHLFAVLARE